MSRHRTDRVMFVCALSIAMWTTMLAAPGWGQTAPRGECATPVPVDDVAVGMTGSGVTVQRGNEVISFDAEVLGVLENGIWTGVDMIVANLESPAIEELGVWAGMSGSPVYAEDGRLIGAVSYTLAASPTTIAGITPADTMLDLYDYPGATAGLGMKQDVALPAAVQRRAVAASDATASEARSGMSPLPTPLAVSGVRPGRMEQVAKRLGLDSNVRPFAAGSAAPDGGSVSDIFPGSNFAAALSYGDLTTAGVGTTTDVCNGAALAFGHPMQFAGRTSLSAHAADAIVIQPDPAWGGSFKVANIGGVVGIVDQDRLLGLRTRLGEGPATTSVRSQIFSPVRNRDHTGRTWVTRSDVVPDIAAFHVWDNLDVAMDAYPTSGRVQLTWTAKGTRGNGTPWTITRTNRFADQDDVSFAAIDELFAWLSAIETNQFAQVDIDDVHATGAVSQTFQRLRFGDVRVAVNNGPLRRIGAIDRLRVRAGDTIRVRVPLIKHQQETPSRTVNLRLAVPRRLAGRSVRLAVVGGANLQGEIDVFGGTSFNDILARMRRVESNNDLIARLQVAGAEGPDVLTKTEQTLGNVVRGRRTVPITIAR